MDNKYQMILNRNLNEVRDAWFEWRSLMAIESVQHPFPDSTFFDIIHSALFNCAIGHLMKVLDQHKDSASFWYIYNYKQPEINAQPRNTERLKKLKHLASPDRLKHIRDKTHFHIDKNAVVDPKQVWRNAGITSKEIYSALLDMIAILQPLFKKEFGEYFPMDYDEDEAKHLAKIAKDLAK
ncbi:MAG: hypothetical protein WA162_03875 [Thermodesulfobacteriota bacterium]